MEVEEEKGRELYLNETLEEIVEGPNKGELLVVWRMLSGLPTQEGNYHTPNHG